MAGAHGIHGPHHRRTGPRAGPSSPEDRVSSDPRGLGRSDETPGPPPRRHRGSPCPRPRPDADAGRGDPGDFPAYVNLTAAVSLVRGGRLDFTRLHGIGSGAVPPVLWGDTLRRLGRMFGPSDEQQALDTWASSQVGMLIVTGIAGIGKSTVVASWLVRQRPRPYIYWFEIHEGTTNSAFLRDLAAFLARLGKRGLTNLLREQDEPEPRVLARLLVHELTDMPILLVLDNFHRAEADLTRLIRGPVFQLSQSTGTKVLVISRTVPVSTSRRKTPREARPEVLRLGGLDLESSLSLL